MTIDRWADPWQLPMANSAIFTHDGKSADPHVARLLARPILQEYDISTVYELACIPPGSLFFDRVFYVSADILGRFTNVLAKITHLLIWTSIKRIFYPIRFIGVWLLLTGGKCK